MAHVIVDTCKKDNLCLDACPSEAIKPLKDDPAYEAATQLYINPEECMDCGACVAECPTNSIYPVDELPADKAGFAEKNAAFYAK
jgi:NAD-dependent dihydropyrimidine dehydrogenase PreA subunit